MVRKRSLDLSMIVCLFQVRLILGPQEGSTADSSQTLSLFPSLLELHYQTQSCLQRTHRPYGIDLMIPGFSFVQVSSASLT